LVMVINTFLNEEYFPEKKLLSLHTSQIVYYKDTWSRSSRKANPKTTH
jgi:hypothetical protein